MGPAELKALGLGLPPSVVRLARAEPAWSVAGQRLVADVRSVMGDRAADVEHIGSTAVPGLLCKPIVDIAVRLAPTAQQDEVVGLLEAAGWTFRGDAGDTGGLVFVMFVADGFRVAHLHAVGPADEQWGHYLRLRERLRSDPGARSEYEEVKRRLAEAYPYDRVAYTDGKDAVVRRLRCWAGPPVE